MTPDNCGFRSTLDSAMNQGSGQGSNVSSSSSAATQAPPQPQVQDDVANSTPRGNSGKGPATNSGAAPKQKASTKAAGTATGTAKPTVSQNATDASLKQAEPASTNPAISVINTPASGIENPQVLAEVATNSNNAGAGSQAASSAPVVAAAPEQTSASNLGQESNVVAVPEGSLLAVTAPPSTVSADGVSAGEAEAPNQTLPAAAIAIPASSGQPMPGELAANSTEPSQPVANPANLRETRDLSVAGDQKTGNAKAQPTAVTNANPAAPGKGTVSVIGSVPVDSIQMTTSPKAAAGKTRGEHVGAASTAASSELPTAKVTAASAPAAGGNNSAPLTTGNSQAATASAASAAIAAGNTASSSTVNSQTPAASVDSAAAAAGSSVVSSSTGNSQAVTASAGFAAAVAGNNSQSSSDGSHSGGSPADSQTAAGAPFVNLAGSVTVSHPGISAGPAGAEEQGQTASASVPASASSAERPQTTPEAESPTLISPRVLESAQQTEMRVGVHPDGMGPIEIRAVMHGDQLGASISAQQADTHQWLVSHVNELAQTLNAHDLRVSNLSISDSPAGNSAQSGFGQPDTQGQGYQRNQPALQRETPEPESNTEIEDRPTGQTYSRAGVDLRA